MDSTSPRKHIIIPGAGETRDYGRPRQRIEPPAAPIPSDRRGHGRRLQEALAAVPDRHRESVEAAGLDPDAIIDAYYLTFRIDSLKTFDVETLAPDQNRTGIRILAVQNIAVDEAENYEITVFVPASQLTQFQRKVAAYLESVDEQRPRLSGQIDRWISVDLASIRQFWTDRSPFPADDQTIWWEVWLRHEEDSDASLEMLRAYCQRADIAMADKAMVIDDRVVTLAKGTPFQWAQAPLVIAYLAEFRRARELATPFLDLSNPEQRDWANDLADRLLQMGANMPAVCVVDSGVNRGHPLLEASLAERDQHACVQAWNVEDVADPAFIGHGTGMAGLALLGERLPDLLLSRDNVELLHQLESVKILPRHGGNAPDLYGARTIEATTGPETEVPDRRRAYVLAVTAADSEGTGEPSLWAATVDALAVGRSVHADADNDRLEHLSSEPDYEDARLWVLASGNIRDGYVEDYLEACDGCGVENPAEAWNAVTVGAMTDLHDVQNASGEERPVAPRGELCPMSRTSTCFDLGRPIKPEIVMEGGNAHIDGDGQIGVGHTDLSLLTTSHDVMLQQFTCFNGTSAASALAARLAARIWADYPTLWPETIRGLLIHSARWTPAMREHFNSRSAMSDRAKLLRRYGWGVPDEARALRCLGHKLTLICQDEFQPFTGGRYHEMCLHRLPWPREALQALGEEMVRLRVTLSTFIDPHPSRRGRYGYPSHQLRFDLKRPTEDVDAFLARINDVDRDDSYASGQAGNDGGWFFGVNARTRGSIFCDIWRGTGADLATRSELAVLPVSGWWKDKELDHRARYALIVSIETERQDVDLWAEVMNAIEATGIPVQIES